MKKLLFTLFVLPMAVACTTPQTEVAENPFFTEYKTPFGAPPFESIDTTHYMPAFIEGMKEQKAEVEAIVNNPDAATFDNTIAALDASGGLLGKVSAVFYGLQGAETNDALQNIAKEVSPLLSEHADNISLNAGLFARIKAVHDSPEAATLTTEQKRLLDHYYKDFVRSGALLSDSDKESLMEINKELGLLSLQFGENLLAETNDFKLVVEQESDLAGLPQWFKDASLEDGKWVFTLQSPSYVPFMQYADNRDLREKMYKAYTNRCDNDNAHDNKAIVAKIVNLRLKKAQLMGFDNYADFVLDDTMAKTKESVDGLVNRVWGYALKQAKVEAKELQQMVVKSGENFKLAGWDWQYYAEKLRKEKYDLDEEELKPYFKLENVRDGAFAVANKLYGITFTELQGMPKYHKDVTAFEVKDADGSHIGVLYLDYFPRAGKSGGAWMSNFREQQGDVRPIVYNVGNFTKPTQDTPSLLTRDEVLTLFHEFGHGLHGLLSKCNYLSVSGTYVARDFVELPSQIMENWALQPEVLKLYAKHYKTGADMPDELIAKMQKSSHFNQGFATTEFVAAALLDLNWHTFTTEQKDLDVRAYEKQIVDKIGLIPEIAVRYRTPYFSHIFDGGYAVGYYSYLWAEVLDADAFEAFKEHGLFDPATAKAFRTNILEKGGSDDPMDLYRKFRGAEPNPNSLLKRRGLID